MENGYEEGFAHESQIIKGASYEAPFSITGACATSTRRDVTS